MDDFALGIRCGHRSRRGHDAAARSADAGRNAAQTIAAIFVVLRVRFSGDVVADLLFHNFLLLLVVVIVVGDGDEFSGLDVS